MPGLCCAVYESDDRAKCRRRDETGSNLDDVHARDTSSGGVVTVDVDVEDRATMAPGPGGAGVGHPRTTRESGTVRAPSSPRASPSSDGIVSPDVRPRPCAADPGDADCPSSTSTSSGDDRPAAIRPGRFTDVEILERIFPLQRRRVLDLVLAACNGDLVETIEQFLSARETLIAQRRHPYLSPHHQYEQLQPFRRQNIAAGDHGRTAVRDGRPGDACGMSAGAGARHHVDRFLSAPTPRRHVALAESAFLPPSSCAALGPHSAVSLRSAAFAADALLGRIGPGLPPPPPLPSRPPSALGNWPRSPAGTGFARPTSPNPALLGVGPHHQLRVLASAPALVDHYVRMMAAVAVARTPPSRGMPGSTCPAVAVADSGTSGGQRGVMTNRDHDTDRGQAPHRP